MIYFPPSFLFQYLGQEYLELEAPLLDTPPSSEDESNDDEETCAYLL